MGNTETPQHRLRKSISNERTFSSTDDQSFIYKKLSNSYFFSLISLSYVSHPNIFIIADEIAESLSDDMQKESLSGRTLTLKLKTSSFEVSFNSGTLLLR